MESVEEMNNYELIKSTIEEFSRLQSYMELCDEASAAYKLMKPRYIELKVLLTSMGINLTELDVIKK